MPGDVLSVVLSSPKGEAIVTIGDRQWAVDLATTAQELATGLGGLPFLPQGTGMLFDMGVEQIIGVTTEPMLFPIDIVFISGELTVAKVVVAVSPGQQITSGSPARYFLEVNAGEASGIVPGDPVLVQVVRPAQAGVGDTLGQLANLMMGVAVLGLVGSMARGMVAATLPRPPRGHRPARRSPVLYGPRGERLLPKISSRSQR